MKTSFIIAFLLFMTIDTAVPKVTQADTELNCHIEQYTRRTIYHSPQTPGYTCWVGAWIMPDNSMMVTFKQATGPIEGRPRFSNPENLTGYFANDPNRDFTGLQLANIYLRSKDNGATWNITAEDRFPGPFDRPAWGGSHIGLGDGAILRAVDGSQLPLVAELPRRIFFQRSHDSGNTWGSPEIPPEPRRPVEITGDYGDAITRVKRLSDGRLAATGVIRPDSDNRRIGEPLLMFSTDDGMTWQTQRIILPPDRGHDPGAWNEWDSAELPDGGFFCVFRRTDPSNPRVQVRWQGRLSRMGDNVWILEDYAPSELEHSGHPELLTVREGMILHIATTGIHYTSDAGATWRPLNIEGGGEYRSVYYPRSFQDENGLIYVFGHKGWDNGYGEYDQAIIMDTFRISLR